MLDLPVVVLILVVAPAVAKYVLTNVRSRNSATGDPPDLESNARVSYNISSFSATWSCSSLLGNTDRRSIALER